MCWSHHLQRHADWHDCNMNARLTWQVSVLQPDELDSACAEAGKDKAALENGETDRFTGIPPISTRRSNSIRSDISKPSASPLHCIIFHC